MNLLGLDTSTPASAACVLRSDGEAFEAVPAAGRLLGPPAHSAELMPAAAGVLEEAALGFGDLDAIAVGVGPGTFTGLRIGIATARGLAHASGLPLRPVSSLAALAAGIGAPLALALIDARRGEVFAALRGADGDELVAPFVDAPERAAERVLAATGGSAGLLAAGNGSLRFRDALEAAGIGVAPAGSAAHAVRALHVCRLAAGVADREPHTVSPCYLRAPDAKPAR